MFQYNTMKGGDLVRVYGQIEYDLYKWKERILAIILDTSIIASDGTNLVKVLLQDGRIVNIHPYFLRNV